MKTPLKSRITIISVLIVAIVIIINLPKYSSNGIPVDNQTISEQIITEQDGIQISKNDTLITLKDSLTPSTIKP